MRRSTVAALTMLALVACPPGGAADWTWNMAFTQWAGSNRSDRYYTSTPEYCDARAAQIAAAGYTAVILSGYHFRLNFLDREDDVRAITRTIVEACHRHGLRVIEHVDLTVVYYDAYPPAWQHPDWFQLHAADMLTRHRIFCFNNPEFRRFYIDWATGFQRDTGVDAWQMDEISWMGRGYCGCRWCRAKWRAEKGRPYPAAEAPGFFDRALADPQYREWMHWRGDCLNDFRATVREALRAVNPDVRMFNYTTTPQSSPYVWARGGDYASRMHSVDTIGTELNAVPFDSYPYIVMLLAQRRALSEVTGTPAWAKFDITRPSAYFCWAFGRACGHSIWWSLQPDNQDPRPQELLEWPGQMNDETARLDADVGVLLSASTRDLRYDFEYFEEEFDGWLQALLLGNYATRVIIESELTQPGALDRFRLVVLPNCTVVSPEQKAALMAWVRAGGRLLLTCEAGTLDADGNPSADPLLAEAGVTLLDQPPDPARLPEPLHDKPVVQIRAEDGTEVVMRVSEAPGALPLITRRKLGEGEMWYLAVKLGPGACEHSQLSAHYRKGGFIPPDDPSAIDDITSIARAVLKDLSRFEIGTPNGPVVGPVFLEAPRGLLSWVYRAERDGRPARAIHLLNCTGRDLQPGEPIEFDRNTPPPAPPLPELTVRLPGTVTEAVLASPELTEPVALPVRRDNDRTTIIIPAESFATYGVIWAYD